MSILVSKDMLSQQHHPIVAKQLASYTNDTYVNAFSLDRASVITFKGFSAAVTAA